jgi:hypothetical protein
MTHRYKNRPQDKQAALSGKVENDFNKVGNYISKHFPKVPKVITWAPVCRPGWLVEVECVAYVRNND